MDIAGYATEIIEKTNIAIVLTAQGVVRDASPKAVEILGLPKESLIGTTLTTIVPLLDAEPTGHPERFVYNGRTIEHTWFRLNHPGTNAHILSDVTDTVESETALRRRTAQLQSALESLPFDFWINDIENRTILQNRYSKELWGDKHGVHMEDVTDDPEITRKWRRTNDLAFQGIVSTDEIEYLIDGEKRTFRNIVAPVRDGEEIVGILGLNIDIGEYKRALQERDELLRELHHRVKNNLQLILSMVAIERDASREGEQRTDAIDRFSGRIERQIYSIYLVQEQLLHTTDVSRIDLIEYLRNLNGSGAIAIPCDGGHMTLDIGSTPVFSPIERAVPFGILIQEIVEKIVAGCTTEPVITITATPKDARLQVEVSGAAPSTAMDDTPLSEQLFVRGLLAQIDATLTASETTEGYGYLLTFSPNSL